MTKHARDDAESRTDPSQDSGGPSRVWASGLDRPYLPMGIAERVRRRRSVGRSDHGGEQEDEAALP